MLKELIYGSAIIAALGMANCRTMQGTRAEQDNLMQTSMPQTPEEDQKVLGYLADNGFMSLYLYAHDSKGKLRNVKQILAQSANGETAKEYAASIADHFYEIYKDKKYATLDSKISMAKETIMMARTELQRKDAGGQGNYTLEYEYDFMKDEIKNNILKSTAPAETKKRELEALAYQESEQKDSVQTFDEFLGPKDERIFAGDCDDFATALTTTYYAISEYAEANKDKEFYAALAEGLKHYRIYSMEIKNHGLNLAVTLDGKIEFEVIEPQDTKIRHQLESRGGFLYIRDGQTSLSLKHYQITDIFNRDISATVKEEP